MQLRKHGRRPRCAPYPAALPDDSDRVAAGAPRNLVVAPVYEAPDVLFAWRRLAESFGGAPDSWDRDRKLRIGQAYDVGFGNLRAVRRESPVDDFVVDFARALAPFIVCAICRARKTDVWVVGLLYVLHLDVERVWCDLGYGCQFEFRSSS